MNVFWNTLCSSIPAAPNWEINWPQIETTPIGSYLRKMAETPQNPLWHGEGDVLTHTKMVCEELVRDEQFRRQPRQRQIILFLAALLHDIGKIPCTKSENGVWISPNHTLVGSKMARELLWKNFGLCGTAEKQTVREAVCNLIRFHSVPLHVMDQKEPERRLIQIAAQGELIPDFRLSLLQILVQADVKGRICGDLSRSLEACELCFLLAEEENLLDTPAQFPSDVTKEAYLSGRQVWKGQELYDDTWGEVIMMSGLPGTGKDTWIQTHLPDLPMISLDEIRAQLRILPTHPQGRVIQEARERARQFLRSKQSFVWNATDLSSMIRGKQLTLFEQYHAHTRIIYLETDWERMLEQNRSREAVVPEGEILHMLKNTEPPERREARTVEWICL